jgi:hypothetical protein
MNDAPMLAAPFKWLVQGTDCVDNRVNTERKRTVCMALATWKLYRTYSVFANEKNTVVGRVYPPVNVGNGDSGDERCLRRAIVFSAKCCQKSSAT